MSKSLSARITFELAAEPQQLQFHTTSSDNPWRFLADDTAIELVPICDSLAQTVPKPPLCDRLEIWPVRWGYPQSLIENHPDEVEQMRKDHHAGKHDLINGNLTWDAWLNDVGIFQLWLQYRTPELIKQWLNCDTVITNGFTVFKLAGQNENSGFPTVRRLAIDGIRFRADCYLGEKFQTVYLAACIKSPLTTDERKLSPGHAAREDELIWKRTDLEEKAATNNVQGAAVALQLQAAAKEVAKATEVADLYANPSIADAKNAAVRRGVPKEFVQYCLAEMHVKKFPSSNQAQKAVQTLPLFRALRDPKSPSRKKVWGWQVIIRAELESRGQIQPRVKGPAAGKAANYDISKHAAPLAHDETEEGGRTDRDPGGHNVDNAQGYD